MENHDHHRPAEFAERVLAFVADAAIFAFAWWLTVKATAPGLDVRENPKGGVAVFLWLGVYFVYQAFFNSDGRATAGKRLLGLRVHGADGRALDLTTAIVRAAGNFLSQLFAIGYLLALVDPKGRALHDVMTGSRVIALGPLTDGRRRLVQFAAGGILVVFAGAWGWQTIWGQRYDQIMAVASARVGLKEYDALQKTYKATNGHYATNVFSLATVSVDPGGFLRDQAALFDRGLVSITVDHDHYYVVARAHDKDRTLVAMTGP